MAECCGGAGDWRLLEVQVLKRVLYSGGEETQVRTRVPTGTWRSLPLLPTGSEEKEVLGVGSIPVAILPSCQYIKMLHHNCIDMDIVG